MLNSLVIFFLFQSGSYPQSWPRITEPDGPEGFPWTATLTTLAISEFEQFLLHLQGCIRKRPHIEDEKNELDRVEQKSKEH